MGVAELSNVLLSRVVVLERSSTLPFLFYIDHCFAIKGQGTVLTGTVVRGSLRVNDSLELPEQRLVKKVRSMQVFRQPVASCREGDRVGICLTQLDPGLIERGVACAPGTVPTFEAAVAAVEKVRFFAGDVRSRSKLHVAVGHSTVLAEVVFFGLPDGQGQEGWLPPLDRISQLSLASEDSAAGHLDGKQEYLYQESLYGLEGRPVLSLTSQEQEHSGDLEGSEQLHYGPQWAYLRFGHAVTAPADSLVIGSRLDADLQATSCRQAGTYKHGWQAERAGCERLAFYGRLVRTLDPGNQSQLLSLRIFKPKQREGVIERVEGDGCTAICRGMFKKDTDLSKFTGMRVTALPSQQEGRIEGSFGKSGKFKVYFAGGVTLPPAGQASIILRFKKFLFDADKKHISQ
ncbi:hypothetical protein N2152v2_007856 [Parachlorella kessleri]